MLKRHLAVVVFLFAALPQAFGNEGVLPPQSHPFGVTYGEWTARWWEFMVSIPAPNNPILDTTGGDCGIGQAGPVWFLGGASAPGVTRTCTAIPVGKAILFPIINAECSRAEGNGSTFAELSSCAKAMIDLVDVGSLSASVDGVPLSDLTTFRFQSPLFTFVVPPNAPPNPPDVISVLDFGSPPTQLVPSGPSPSVSDGYWIMLVPLSVGTHTIRFHGAVPAFGFEESATITVHIVPKNP